MNGIKFSHNWNNKLDCPVFTTIRKATPEKSHFYNTQKGEIFRVILNEREIKKAVLINLRTSKFENIPLEILCLDVGYSLRSKITDIFNKFGIQDETSVLILTFHSI